MYQLREGQFSHYMSVAQHRRGVSGANLLQILETRLDSVVYRLGWAKSRGMARQMVTHRFFAVNGVPTNVPSFLTRPNDKVSLVDKKRATKAVAESLKSMTTHRTPGWLELDTNTFDGKVLHAPARDEIDTQIREQMIVEYYTR